MTASPIIPRRGLSTPLGNGLRRDHTVACTVAGASHSCECPYSFWQPRTVPRRRVRVRGTLQQTLALREGMQRCASDTIDLTIATPYPTTQDAADGDSQAPTDTLDEWAQRLFSNTWRDHSPGTITRRQGAYRLYIKTHLATTPLPEITPATVEDWLTTLAAAGAPPSQVQYSYDLLRAMLTLWHKRHGTENPMVHVSRPRNATPARRARDRTLTAAQYQQLVSACHTPREQLLIRTAVEAGLRTGELCGLQRGDIDLAACTIRVERQGDRDTTKNGKTRTVAISSDLAAVFAEHLSEMIAQGHTASDRYIWRGTGQGKDKGHQNRPYDRSALWRFFNRLFVRAELVDDNGTAITSPHGLRATGATLAAQAGVPIHTIQHQLGHSRQKMTEDHYINTASGTELAAYAEAFARQAPGALATQAPGGVAP